MREPASAAASFLAATYRNVETRMTSQADLTGRWRITSMELWDTDTVDLVEPGFIEFDRDGTGRFGFIAVAGWMDCREATRDDPHASPTDAR